MTPSRLDARVVVERLAWVEQMIAGIRALPLESQAAFVADVRNVAAAESYLRRALEALLDLGRHVLAKGFGQPVAEYKEIPRHLQRLAIIDDAGATRMTTLAGYRNRMVHFYAEVSTAELYDICARQLGDVVSCAEALRAWIAAHPDQVDQAL